MTRLGRAREREDFHTREHFTGIVCSNADLQAPAIVSDLRLLYCGGKRALKKKQG